jgi:hypothetical protein
MRAKLTHENPPYEEAPCLYPNYLDRWKAILKIIFVGFSVAGQVAIVFDLFGADLKRTCRARMRTVNGYDLGAEILPPISTLITSWSRGFRGWCWVWANWNSASPGLRVLMCQMCWPGIVASLLSCFRKYRTMGRVISK